MSKAVFPSAVSDHSPQAQELYVDGHKVTIRYSEQTNPAAVQAIRNVLINSISSKKV